jgi:hypothetical protein
MKNIQEKLSMMLFKNPVAQNNFQSLINNYKANNNTQQNYNINNTSSNIGSINIPQSNNNSKNNIVPITTSNIDNVIYSSLNSSNSNSNSSNAILQNPQNILNNNINSPNCNNPVNNPINNPINSNINNSLNPNPASINTHHDLTYTNLPINSPFLQSSSQVNLFNQPNLYSKIFDVESRRDQLIFDTDYEEDCLFKVSSKGNKEEARSFNLANFGYEGEPRNFHRKDDSYDKKIDFDLDQFFKSSE